MNLTEGLLQEMNRVRDVIKIYEEHPNTAFAIAMMRQTIANAESAIGGGDVIAMMQYYKELQDCE